MIKRPIWLMIKILAAIALSLGTILTILSGLAKPLIDKDMAQCQAYPLKTKIKSYIQF